MHIQPTKVEGSLTPAEVAMEVLRDCVAGRVRQISRVVTQHYDTQLRPYGITANQLTILCLVVALGPSKSIDLEPYLMMEQSTLSRNLRRMADRGWLDDEADEVDRRAVLFSASRSGVELLREAHPAWRRAQDWAQGLLTAAGIEHLKDASRSLNGRLP